MKLDLNEKYKIQQLLEDIQDGNFKDTDVDSIIFKLREHAPSESRLRELGHFLAHNSRDQGLSRNYAYCLFLRFKLAFDLGQKKLDVNMFPSYVKEMLLVEAEYINLNLLKIKGLNRKTLKQAIENKIDVNEQLQMAYIKPDAIRDKGFDGIIELLSVTRIGGVFSGEELFGEITNILKKLNFKLDDKRFLAQKSKLILSLFMIVYNSEIIIDKGRKITLSIGELTNINNIVKPKTLVLWSSIMVGNHKMTSPFFKTDLLSSEFCDKSLWPFLENRQLPSKVLLNPKDFKLYLHDSDTYPPQKGSKNY